MHNRFIIKSFNVESVVQSANAKISLGEQLFLTAADDVECAYIKTLVSTSAFLETLQPND